VLTRGLSSAALLCHFVAATGWRLQQCRQGVLFTIAASYASLLQNFICLEASLTKLGCCCTVCQLMSPSSEEMKGLNNCHTIMQQPGLYTSTVSACCSSPAPPPSPALSLPQRPLPSWLSALSPPTAPPPSLCCSPSPRCVPCPPPPVQPGVVCQQLVDLSSQQTHTGRHLAAIRLQAATQGGGGACGRVTH